MTFVKLSKKSTPKVDNIAALIQQYEDLKLEKSLLTQQQEKIKAQLSQHIEATGSPIEATVNGRPYKVCHKVSSHGFILQQEGETTLKKATTNLFVDLKEKKGYAQFMNVNLNKDRIWDALDSHKGLKRLLSKHGLEMVERTTVNIAPMKASEISS